MEKLNGKTSSPILVVQRSNLCYGMGLRNRWSFKWLAQLLGASNTNNGYRMAEPIFNEFIDRLRSGEGSMHVFGIQLTL